MYTAGVKGRRDARGWISRGPMFRPDAGAWVPGPASPRAESLPSPLWKAAAVTRPAAWDRALRRRRALPPASPRWG